MRLRYVLIGAAVAVVVIFVAGAIIIARTDLAPYVARVEAAVKDATGRELKIKGPVGFRLSLFPTVAAENVSFQNARWGSRPLMAEAKRVEVQVALLPLLTGDIVIRRLELVAPDVLLEVNAKGEKNWAFAKPAAAPETKAPPGDGAAVQVRQVRITKGALTYRQARPKLEHRAQIDDLRIDASSGYDSVEFNGEGKLNGVAVALNGSLDNLGRAGAAGAVGDLELTANAGGNKLKASGAVPLSGAGLAGLDAKVSASVPDAAALQALLQRPVPRL
ncbi:MAG TPA: AsmA family protein, partial [Pelomicrobium sp.]|nr:AsmA family protein [Pelomicrobium sp.]